VKEHVFDCLHEFHVTEPSFVVGCGPRGQSELKHIPEHCFTIAVNGAIKYPISADLWVCTCAAVPYVAPDVWEAGLNSGVPALMRRDKQHVVALDRQVYMDTEKARYTMRGHHMGSQGILQPGQRTLDEGGTAAGVSIALLYRIFEAQRFRCRTIVLNGIDMEGDFNADGSRVWESDIDPWKHKRPWLRKLIDRARELGVTVVTLSRISDEIGVPLVDSAEIDRWYQ